MTNKTQVNDYIDSPVDNKAIKHNKRNVKSSKVDGLTFRQRKFVRAYSEGNTMGNGVKSAIKAGYSENGAGVMAHTLLKNPKVLAILNDSVEEAEGVIRSLMNDPRELGQTRLAAAREVLDRTVGKPIQRSINVGVTITPESMLDTPL